MKSSRWIFFENDLRLGYKHASSQWDSQLKERAMELHYVIQSSNKNERYSLCENHVTNNEQKCNKQKLARQRSVQWGMWLLINVRWKVWTGRQFSSVTNELGFGSRQRNTKNSRGRRVRPQSLCNEDNKDFLHAYEVHAAGSLALGLHTGCQKKICPSPLF